MSRADRLDSLTVHVERAVDTASEDSKALAGSLKKEIKDYVGVTTTIVVGDPGSVPRSEGKAVRVIDER